MQKDETTIIEKIRLYFKKRCLIQPPVEGDPRLLTPKIKTGIVACVSLVACTAGFSSTIYFPGNISQPYKKELTHLLLFI